MIEERRSKPADDLLSDLIAAEEEGDRLDTDELVGLADAVLMAGTDTTRNQLACSVALFCRNIRTSGRCSASSPISLDARSRRRCVASALSAARRASRPKTSSIETSSSLTGTLVATSLTGANFDSAVFDDPETFDITKERSTPQMTFGSGIHFCLGASLARSELAEALPLLARRMPDLEVDGSIEWKPPTVGIWGPARLPLRFTPGH